ncbi:MAG TPA: CoA pyrophosphatase [Thermoanaerobaculia bacterium]|jgi:mutator protein MutT|nr:CoA pyrophosphatase [Thermoanaerobaculia bacterium]
MFDDVALGRLRGILAQRPAIEIDDAPQHRRACVLIPFVRNNGGWSILFTKRSENLAAHGGQIAFPGGSVEAGESLDQAAIREAEEEVGIPPHQVELIGRLDDVITHSGFLVAPFVAVIHEPFDVVIQEAEVVEVFEVRIEALLDVANPEVRYVMFRGTQHPAYFYHHGPHEIWGLTGRMLKATLDLVWQAI